MSLRIRLQNASIIGRTAASFVGLLARAVVTSKDREQFKAIARALGVYPRQPRLRTASVIDIFGQLPRVSIATPDSGAWQVSIDELVTICGIAQVRRAGRAFELGTYDGRTTVNLVLNLNNGEPDSVVVTVDLPPERSDYPVPNRAGRLIQDLGLSARVELLLCDSTTADFSRFRDSMDLVFVDAGHNYENVVADSRTAEMVSRVSGSVVLFHDYGNIASVTQAIDELADRHSVDDFYWLQGTSLACWIRR